MTPRACRAAAGLALLAGLLLAAAGAQAEGPIATDVLRAAWPRQRARSLEVGRHPVRWRQAAAREHGIFGGVRFVAPLPRERLWSLTTDYTDLGELTPGVQAVRYVTDTPAKRVIEVDVQVLWKTLTLRFEVEQDPPQEIRFRLVHDLLGEYRGACWLEPAEGGSGTVVELATWLQPARPVPAALILMLERMTFLQATRAFLEACDAEARDAEARDAEARDAEARDAES